MGVSPLNRDEWRGATATGGQGGPRDRGAPKSSRDSGTRPRIGIDVLVVEDDRELAEMLRTALLADSTKRVRVAHDLESARAAIRARTPAILVMDAFLPDGHGAELAFELRRRGDPMAIGIVATSGQRPDEGPGRWYDAFLQKPVDLARLSEVIRILARVVAGEHDMSPDSEPET